jgi:serine/threonine protein kinase
MALLFVCRQGHRWQADQPPDRAKGDVLCPYCGNAGQSQETLAAAATIDASEGTLPPAATPPLVEKVPTLKPPSRGAPGSGIAPERIGNYQVVGELGRGGMGVVYKARQQGLDRFVAVKMILASKYALGQAVGRFRQEAEAVARLQHPNIVQIYEIGEHEGRPYFALEYVAGSSLARTLAGRPQPPPAAARFIQTLSRAVAHAHRRGIVHRDLTPANVLLATADEAPAAGKLGSVPGDLVSGTIPKITDFGLAKRLDADAGQTVDGTVMGTPNYMSPEQAAGRIDAIGPQTDVYALGAVLYELLTGRPPFVGETAMATVDQVIHRDPLPPSYLQPRIPRDLETICLKCLEKDQARRYASADDLADDLGRFLEQRPILARRTSIVGRAWKWSKRRPAATALIAVAALSTIGFVVGSQWYSAQVRWERDRAEEDYRQSMRTIDRMLLTEFNPEQLVYDPGQEQRHRPQLEAALALYQQFLKRWAHDARLRQDTAHAHRKLGDIERWLGNHEKAQSGYREAIAIYEQLRREDQDRPEYRRWQAYCWNFLGEAHRLASQPKEAEAAYDQAIALQKALADQQPARPEHQQELAQTYYNLGILYRETNRQADAEKVLRQAVELLDKLVRDNSQRPDDRQGLARAHINLGPILRASHRAPAAIAAYGRAIELLDKLTQEFPKRPDYRLELAVAHVNRGNAFRADNQLPKAKEDYDIAQKTLAALVVDYPHVPLFLQELANCENSLAAVLVKTDGLAAAEKAWLDACRRLRQLDARPGALPAYRGDLGMTLGNLGWVYLQMDDAEKSRRYLQEGTDYLEKALLANPEHPDYQLSLRSQYRYLAEAALKLGGHAASAAAATQLAKSAGGSSGDEFQAACLLIRAGAAADADAALSANDRQQQGQRSFGQALTLLRHLSQSGFADLQSIEQASASLRAALEKNAELKEALADLEAQARKKAAPSGAP